MPTNEEEIVASKVALIACKLLARYNSLHLITTDILHENYGGMEDERAARANSVNKALVTAIDLYAVSHNLDQVKVAAAIKAVKDSVSIVGHAYGTFPARNEPVRLTIKTYACKKVRVCLKTTGIFDGYIDLDYEPALRFKHEFDKAFEAVKDSH